MSLLVRLLLIVLVLAPVVRPGPVPVCCEPQHSCCPSSHDADCCERGLSFDINRSWDHALQPPSTDEAAALDLEVSGLADLVTAVLPPLDAPGLAPWQARDGPRRPPPPHIATTILRL